MAYEDVNFILFFARDGIRLIAPFGCLFKKAAEY